MINENLLWSMDEYKAVVDYKGNSYSKINILLSEEVTKRESEGKSTKMQTLQTEEEFRESIEKIIKIYSAIKKHYVLNGRQECSKTLFRGTKDGKIDTSFISTSDSVRTAFDFAKMFESMNGEAGTLLAIKSSNVPWIETNSLISSAHGIEDEPEFLFLPAQLEEIEQVDLAQLFDIARQQGEKITAEQAILKKFASLKCKTGVLKELDYSTDSTEYTIDDLCNMFKQYKRDIEVIRSAEKGSEEWNVAYKRITQFKKECNSFIHQRFYEINQSIDNQMIMQQGEIQLSSQYDMSEVFIGNTGEMYQITNKENEDEYYFKPAVSKDGEERPYRAYIQEAAYNIQQIINPDNAVRCNRITINGIFGAIQEKVPIDEGATKAFREYFKKGEGELSPQIISQVLDEYLVDFCLCNYDAHARNFIIDKNGRLRGIDKEQSFRYISEDSGMDMMFGTNYNEIYGESPTIYNILFERIKQGKISYKLLDTLRYKASRLSQFPDEQYKKIFEEYAYGKAKIPEEAETLLGNILARKSNVLQNVEQLYNGIANEYSKNNNGKKTEPVLDSAVEATIETTKLGTMKKQVEIIKGIKIEKTKDLSLIKSGDNQTKE